MMFSWIRTTASGAQSASFVRLLKDDAETPRFIQTVTGRGYRFIAPVISPEEEHSAELPNLRHQSSPQATGISFRSPIAGCKPAAWAWWSQEQERTAGKATASETARGQVTSAVLGRGFSLERGFAGSRVHSVTPRSLGLATSSRVPTVLQRKTVLAVLPFDNLSRDPDQEFFSDGLTEEMIAQVGKLNRDRLTVVARSSVAKYKGSKLAAKEIGKELNADYLVQGSVRRSVGPCTHHRPAHPGTRSDRPLDRELRPRTQRCASCAGLRRAKHRKPNSHRSH